MNICKDIINDLLKPFKMQLHPFAGTGWEILTDDSNPVSIIQNNGIYSYALTWFPGNDGLDQIMKLIMIAKKWTIAKLILSSYDELPWNTKYETFDNPYFGCTSLEEMLIKKDLIA
jgi:hypothetical protein